jgi:hypothetical protein
VLRQRLERGALERALRQRVLDDLVVGLAPGAPAAQLGDLGDLQPLVVDQDGALGALEGRLEVLQFFDLCLLL